MRVNAIFDAVESDVAAITTVTAVVGIVATVFGPRLQVAQPR